MSLSDVSNILWRERQLLELLVFKLEEEQLVLAAGRNKWLTHATREVETAQEIDSVAKANRDLLQRGQQASRDALLSMGEIDIEAYNASGAVTDRTLAMRLVDRAI